MRIVITADDIDRLAELRQQRNEIDKAIYSLTALVLKSGRDEIEGHNYRAVVVDRSVQIVKAAEVRQAVERNWFMRRILGKFVTTNPQRVVRTYEREDAAVTA